MSTGNFRNLRILNVTGLAGTIAINILANTLPLNGKTTAELSDAYPNLFTPAGYVFSIWGIIYLLLLAFAYYQYSYRGAGKDFLEKIGYLFTISSLANIAWIIFWHYEYLELSVIVMFILLASLIGIYLRLNIGRTEVSRDERLYVHLPFSVYLGWISVAPIANVSALFVKYNWDGLGIGEEIWTIVMVLVAVLLALIMIFQRGDYGYSLVITWALIGILVKQMSNQLISTVAGLGVLIILVFSIIQKYKLT